MNLGFWWGVLHHTLFNCLTLIMISYIHHNSPSIVKKDNTVNLKVYNLQFFEDNYLKKVSFDNNNISKIQWNNTSLQKVLDTIYNKKYKTYDNQLIKLNLTTTKALAKEEFLNILKEEYRIVERDSLK